MTPWSQNWESLVEQLRQARNTDEVRELIMLLEVAVFKRHQELALNANQISRQEMGEEERRLREALRLMLEFKTKKLGFPEFRTKENLG